MGVYTGADLLEQSEMELIDRFGRLGYDLYRKARGISNSSVKVNRERKSIGKEKTYRKLLYQEEDIKKELASLSQRVGASLIKHEKQGRTIVLKMRYGDFQTLTKRLSLKQATNDPSMIEQTVFQLLDQIGLTQKGVRLMGVTVTNF